jgi:hypothetical protein
MISRFSQYLVEEEKVIYFAFGRMNPPTIGHGKLLDVLAAKAGRNPYKIFLSQSQDPKKNPLSYTDKIKSVRKMFPKHARNVMINKKVKTPFDALTALYDEGYRKVVMVAGSDRIAEYDLRLNKYNGKEGGHGLYNFKDGIKMVSAGERDPDAEGAEGASGTKQRGFASDNDFIKFSQGLPPAMNTKDARVMFNAVRKGMGLKEEKSFKNHIALESVSENREAFVAGTLFGLGDAVVIKETQEVCNIVVLGSNYVIVERLDGMRFRKWLDAVEVVESNSGVQPDWGSNLSTKVAKKMTPGQNTGVDESDHPNIWDNIRKRRMSDKPKLKPGQKGYPKTLDLPEENPCWDGFKQVGLKNKNGKMVPNCVREKIEVAQDPDIADKKGSQPATFHKGIKSASTKSKRDAHFSKMAKKADNDPNAYKPAPGDATAKTKPSQYTLKFKRMFGEQQDPLDVAKQRIKREKEADALKHDRALDRARTMTAMLKNRQTK